MNINVKWQTGEGTGDDMEVLSTEVEEIEAVVEECDIDVDLTGKSKRPFTKTFVPGANKNGGQVSRAFLQRRLL